jgi:hypothetical protein
LCEPARCIRFDTRPHVWPHTDVPQAGACNPAFIMRYRALLANLPNGQLSATHRAAIMAFIRTFRVLCGFGRLSVCRSSF